MAGRAAASNAAAAAPGVADLILAHVAARGGAQVLESRHHVEMRIEIVEPRFAVKGHYRATRDGRMRIDIYDADGRRVFSEGLDGDGAWQMPGDAVTGTPVGGAPAEALRRGLYDHLFGGAPPGASSCG